MSLQTNLLTILLTGTTPLSSLREGGDVLERFTDLVLNRSGISVAPFWIPASRHFLHALISTYAEITPTLDEFRRHLGRRQFEEVESEIARGPVAEQFSTTCGGLDITVLNNLYCTVLNGLIELLDRERPVRALVLRKPDDADLN